MLDKPSDAVFLIVVALFLLVPTVPILYGAVAFAPAISDSYWFVGLGLAAAIAACFSLAVIAVVRYRRAPPTPESGVCLPDGRRVPSKDSIGTLFILALVFPSFGFAVGGMAASEMSGPIALAVLLIIAFAPSVLIAIEAQRRYSLRKSAGLRGW